MPLLLNKLKKNGTLFTRNAYSWCKTNIPFLVNVMRNEKFRSGDYTTKFIEETPELFDIAPTLDRGTKTLEYIGNVTINGFPNVENVRSQTMSQLRFRKFQKKIQHLYGTKQLLDEKGPSGVADWLKHKMMF